MRWIGGCSTTPVAKRYQRSVMQFLVSYAVVLLCASWFVKHDGHERFYLYFWSVIPVVPIIGIIVRMGRYLSEETDEFLKLQKMRALLVGLGALLGALVVDDFLRAFAHAPGFGPFVLFTIFAVANGLAQLVQYLANRTRGDE